MEWGRVIFRLPRACARVRDGGSPADCWLSSLRWRFASDLQGSTHPPDPGKTPGEPKNSSSISPQGPEPEDHDAVFSLPLSLKVERGPLQIVGSESLV